MNKITDSFLKLFYKISQIPRESGHEKRFADFLEMFAKENNLEYYKDKSNNVLIKKNGKIYGVFLDEKMIAWIFLSLSNRMKNIKRYILFKKLGEGKNE